MRPWLAAAGVFFLYVSLCAALVPHLRRARRLLGVAVSLAGIGAVLLLHLVPHHDVVHHWVSPPLLLLVSYWGSGVLFAAPMPRVERALEAMDRALRIDGRAARVDPWIADLLELAYLGVYPVIPVALAIHLLGSARPDADWFWTVILVTDFVCFGCLPWIQTRPPRAFRVSAPWRSRLRGVNLHVLGRGSIQVNTFPSGHAAEGVAAALLVSDATSPLAVAVWAAAALISAGAVLGRYHYAADACAGWLVAVLVWLFTPR